MFGKGFFGAGFTGWFRGVIATVIPGRPGKVSLGGRWASASFDWHTPVALFDDLTAGALYGQSTATTEIAFARASISLGME